MASDVDPFPVGERVPFTVGRKTVGMVRRVIMDGGSTATVEVLFADAILGTVTERPDFAIATTNPALLGDGGKSKRRVFRMRELAIAWLFVRNDRTTDPDSSNVRDR